MFIKRNKNEKGQTITEMLVTLGIAGTLGITITPAMMDLINEAESKATVVQAEYFDNLQLQVDTMGEVTISAEDFKKLTDNICTTGE